MEPLLLNGLVALAALLVGALLAWLVTRRVAGGALASRDERIDDLKSDLAKARAALDNEWTRHRELIREHAELKSVQQERQKHHEQQLQLLNEARDQLKKDFELLASEILEKKGRAFRELNSESMKQLLQPLQQDVVQFRSKVEALHIEETKQRSALRQELIHLQQLNQTITEKAEQLTKALRSDVKQQGTWGEMILEKVLEQSGLRVGVDYKREVSIQTDEGRRRPDAIIYLPQDKHLIIDAKTSLNAYTRYTAAETDAERAVALAEHTRAVSDRINELADREYFRLPGLNSPEAVILFIPVESAYVLALKQDASLYQRAIENNVLVATPTTLLTSLSIVSQLWRFENQNKHTAELAKRAEKFYNKLRTFLESMQGLGQQLDKTRDTYNKAVGQLSTGPGNLIKQASEFSELGVAVSRELPPELVEQARLELPESRQVPDMTQQVDGEERDASKN